MKLKCTGCGAIVEGNEPRFCTIITHKNGDPCGSLMLPIKEETKEPEFEKPRKDGK